MQACVLGLVDDTQSSTAELFKYAVMRDGLAHHAGKTTGEMLESGGSLVNLQPEIAMEAGKSGHLAWREAERLVSSELLERGEGAWL